MKYEMYMASALMPQSQAHQTENIKIDQALFYS